MNTAAFAAREVEMSDYKTLKNFIHNEMGVNRGIVDEIVHSYIEARTKQVIQEKIGSVDIEKVIAGIVASEIDLMKKEPVKKDSLYFYMKQGQNAIRGFIKQEIRRQVEDLIQQSLNVDVNFSKRNQNEK